MPFGFDFGIKVRAMFTAGRKLGILATLTAGLSGCDPVHGFGSSRSLAVSSRYMCANGTPMEVYFGEIPIYSDVQNGKFETSSDEVELSPPPQYFDYFLPKPGLKVGELSPIIGPAVPSVASDIAEIIVDEQIPPKNAIVTLKKIDGNIKKIQCQYIESHQWSEGSDNSVIRVITVIWGAR